MENQTPVIKRLEAADILLIFIPIVIVPPALLVIFGLTEPPSPMIGLGAFLGIAWSIIFCVVYGIEALILSLVMRRHKPFRLSLAAGLVILLILPLWMSVGELLARSGR